jgi:hypothetical protein
VLDANANLVTGDSGDAITIGLGANPGGGSLLGTLTVTVQNGVATFNNLAISKPGTGYTLTANSGSLASSTSAACNITLAVSSTVLASSVNASVTGQLVAFTATVSGPGTPTGVVTFLDGGTSIGHATLSTSGGTTTASFNTSSLAVGSHTISASYAGDANFLDSSGKLTLTVGKANTSPAVISSLNMSVSGQTVTFTATITVSSPGSTAAANPSGTLTFADGSTSIGQGTLNTTGATTTASFSTSTMAVGTHTITASYSGDSNFLASSGTLTETVAKASTSMLLVTSVSSALSGQTVTFTTTVTVSDPGSAAAVAPSGIVIFSEGTTSLGQGTLSTSSGKTTASFSTSSLVVGSHTLTASYAGDANFLASSGTLTQTVAKANTSTAVVSSASSSISGQSVTFTATISVTAPGAGTPTGMVQFQIDASNAGSPVSVNTSGSLTTASFSTSMLAVGTHTLTASYSGDMNFATSSGAWTQTVGKAGTTTAVASSVTSSVSGQSVTFTATLTINSPGSSAVTSPSGTVTFSDGATSLGQGTLTTSGGVSTASFSFSSLAPGGHAVTALYAGDGNFLGSNSTLTQTINTASTSTQVLASANPSVFGQSVTITGIVNVASPGTTAVANPSGTVVFYDGTTMIGQGTLGTSSGGVTTAAISSASLGVGTHTITANYSGDGNFAPSNGTLAGGQLVNQASTNTAVASSLNPSVFGQPVIFTASLSAQSPGTGTPTATVQFQIDGVNFGSPVSVVAGVASSAATSGLSVNGHVIQAVYSGDANFAPSTAVLTQTVIPGSPSVLHLSGFSSPSTAGTSENFTVTVQDPYGNTVTGYGGTIHFSSSDTLASLPADYTFTAADNGVHTFSATFLTAGDQSLTATDTLSGTLTGTQSGIIVSPATANRFRIAPSINTSRAGTPFDVTVTVQDGYNNTVAGYTGTVNFSSADPYGATLPASYTFSVADNGSHTFAAGATLYTTGTWDVTATDTVTGITGSAYVAVTPAYAVLFQIVVPATVVSGIPFNATVIALDPYGNVDTNYQGTLTFSTTDPDPGVVLPANYTFTLSDAGVRTFLGGIALVTPGNETISVIDTNGITGSATVTVAAPQPPSGGGGGGGVWGGNHFPWEVLLRECGGNAGDALRPGLQSIKLGAHPDIEHAIDLLFSSGYGLITEMRGENSITHY